MYLLITTMDLGFETIVPAPNYNDNSKIDIKEDNNTNKDKSSIKLVYIMILLCGIASSGGIIYSFYYYTNNNNFPEGSKQYQFHVNSCVLDKGRYTFTAHCNIYNAELGLTCGKFLKEFDTDNAAQRWIDSSVNNNIDVNVYDNECVNDDRCCGNNCKSCCTRFGYVMICFLILMSAIICIACAMAPICTIEQYN